MKRLIVCSDGTWNRADQEVNGQPCATNVIKLATRLANRDADGVLQIVFYDQGVGTGNLADRLSGGAFGVGLEDNILDGYRFLVGNYEPGDQIFLFGFSRGAYTARSLAGMMRKCGILNRKSVSKYLEAVALYRKREDTADGPAAQDFRLRYTINGDQPTPIRMIGVWDTVGALGIPLRGLRWFTRKDEQFHDVQLSRSVERAYHALAVDEHRVPFLPTLWLKKEGADQDVQQVWFAGAHSDVGGGYGETGLSDLALQWMIDKSTGAGLAFDKEAMAVRLLRPNYKMAPHDSRSLMYRVAPGVEREIGLCPVDATKPEGAKQFDPTQSLDESVTNRWRDCPEWRPAGLVRYMATRADSGERAAAGPV